MSELTRLAGNAKRSMMPWSRSRSRAMKRTIQDVAEAGEDLIQQTIEANRAYRKAESSGAPAAEVERLRLLSDSLYETVTGFQLKARGESSDTHH